MWLLNDMTTSEMYTFLLRSTFTLIILSLVLLGFVKTNSHIHFLEKITRLSKKHKRLIFYTITTISIALVIFAVYIQFIIYNLDKSTTIEIDEKIVVIEIDDYWNINESGDFFKKYGYTIERYKEVSDTLDKYGYVASLGVTPYIFLETEGKTSALRDDDEMVNYLEELDDKGYELTMHGYGHCRNEYYCPQYEEVWYNIQDGKRELEDIFDTPIITYLPPGNQWTDAQYNNIKKAGFLMIANTHVPKAYFDGKVIITPRGYDPIYHYDWYGVDFRHTRVEEWIEAYDKKENIFILQLHANTFDSQEKLEDLDEFLRYINEDGAKVMTYKELYKTIMEDKVSLSPEIFS